jgi:hypothetical protein
MAYQRSGLMIVVRAVVAFHVTVHRPPAVMISLMVCVGVQMQKRR